MSRRRKSQSTITVERVASKDLWLVAQGLDHKCFPCPVWLTTKEWQWYDPYLIFLEGAAVGFAAIRPDSNLSLERDRFFASPDTVYLGRIGIVPLFRGRGLASRFLEWLIDWGKRNQYSRITCNSAEANHGSRRLLKKFRFQSIGSVVCSPLRPEAPPLRIIIWERPLTAASSLSRALSG